MKSQVYFIPAHTSEEVPAIKVKLARLLQESKVLNCVERAHKVAIKIHFGEEGNTGYVRPEYVRVIVDSLTTRGAAAFLADTNTLYRGKRMRSPDHLQLAYAHGFTPDIVGVPVRIPDDTREEDVGRITINQRFIQVASLAKLFLEAEVILGLAHFKGHMMTGFGGALKNIGMGCATREGKLAQHSDIAPQVKKKRCTGCAECVAVCPVKAISIKDKKAHLERAKCIGCASCIAACASEAIDVAWSAGEATIQEKMVEYTYAVLKGKEKRRIFFNFVLKITKECDCLAKDDPCIAPDVGILAALDPVSIDKASLDLVHQLSGGDVFKQAHPDIDGFKQLEYAAKIGLGNLDYELIKV